MKRNESTLASIPGAIVLLVFALTSTATAQSKWTQKEFILGTCWDPPFDSKVQVMEKDVENFRLAKDAYFNLLTGTQGEGAIDHSYQGMLWALRAARRLGLYYLVSDNRIYEGFNHEFKESVGREVVGQYAKAPAELQTSIYGYNLCDEPHYDKRHVARISFWKRFLEAADSQRLVYVNLVASYAADQNWGGFTAGNTNGVLDAAEKLEYEKYLANYIDSLHPAVISFDHYPFFKNGTIRSDYLYNLGIIRSKAGNRPFWAYPMTVDHLTYVDPTEEHLNFMYFCPIAYGAKGLIVFTFWPPPYDDYRSALFDRHGKKTVKYEIVKRLNHFVSAVVGPVVMRVPNVAVYNVSRYPGDQLYVSDGVDSNSTVVASVQDKRVLVGVFKSRKETYLFVVNKDLSPIRDVDIVLKGKVTSVSFAPRVVGFTASSALTYKRVPTVLNSTKTRSRFRVPELIGGEGRLLKIR